MSVILGSGGGVRAKYFFMRPPSWLDLQSFIKKSHPCPNEVFQFGISQMNQEKPRNWQNPLELPFLTRWTYPYKPTRSTVWKYPLKPFIFTLWNHYPSESFIIPLWNHFPLETFGTLQNFPLHYPSQLVRITILNISDLLFQISLSNYPLEPIGVTFWNPLESSFSTLYNFPFEHIIIVINFCQFNFLSPAAWRKGDIVVTRVVRLSVRLSVRPSVRPGVNIYSCECDNS